MTQRSIVLKTIIKESPYKLIQNADYLAAWSNEYTSESILDLHVSDLSSGNRELFGYLVDPKGYGSYSCN